MAEKFILPNSVVITAKRIDDEEGSEALVVCLTQNDFNSTASNATIDTFCGSEQLPGSKGQTLAVSFRRIWETDSGRISEKFFYDAWFDSAHIQFTVAREEPVTGDLVYTGTGYVTSYNSANGTNAIPTASMTITADAPMDLIREGS